MMLKPTMSDLVKKTDSRYSLVIAVAKRARQLTEGAEPLTEASSDKPVSIAINEIDQGKVDIYNHSDEIDE